MGKKIGLINSKTYEQLPLEKVNVVVKIKGTTVSILSELQYSNPNCSPIEVVFVFPLEDRAAVCGFQVKIGDIIIKGKVEEKEEAKDTYDDAISSGKSAFLLEESNDSSDIFKISVGNLPVKVKAVVQIECVATLKSSQDGSLLFTLPRALKPRAMGGSDNWTADCERFYPFAKLPSGYCFDMHVEVASEIEKIFSDTDKLKITINDLDKRKALVKFEEGSLQFIHDTEVIIKQKLPFSNHVFIEKGKQEVSPAQIVDEASWKENFENLTVVMLNFFIPQLQLLSKTTDTCFPSEFIFVIDRSGSMSGRNIDSAKEALLLFLKSLPLNSYFDIVSFGSTFTSFFKKSEKYNDKNLTKACEFVKTLAADMGGTEILNPLQEIYKRPYEEKVERNVFLLTDGAVGNTEAVIHLVHENAVKTRCFALGIGQGASTALVNGVANAGRGLADFARNDERLQKKVICMLQKACKPKAGNIKVNWNLSDDLPIKQIPDSIDFIHEGESLIVYGVITRPETKEITGNVTLEYNIEGRDHKEDLSFNIQNDAEEDTKHFSLHALAAKDYVSQCNPADPLLKDDIIKLSKASGVISKYTSYIAVDEVTQVAVEGPMIYRNSAAVSAELQRSREKLKMLRKCRYRVSEEDTDCSVGISSAHPSLPHNSKQSHFVLVSFQSASGKWDLTNEFSCELGMKHEELTSNVPACLLETSSKADDINPLWATALAIVWLTSNKFELVQDELCMILEKAERWLLNHMPTSVARDQIVQDAKKTLA